jgi:hypothetical protein
MDQHQKQTIENTLVGGRGGIRTCDPLHAKWKNKLMRLIATFGAPTAVFC